VERLHNPSVKDRTARSLPPVAVESATCDRISFRPLTRPDFPLLGQWLGEPHVARWWHEPFDLKALEAKYGPCIDGVEPTHLFLIEFDKVPIGFIQWYRWSDYSEHAEKIGASRRSAGVDLLIGKPDMIGIGIGPAAIWKIGTELIFVDPAIDALVSDPEEANVQSLRAFAKAGFQISRKLRHGEAETRCIVRLSRPFSLVSETNRVRLIGPGGAGKSTVGAVLAERLGIGFLDLDQYLAAIVGDIGAHIHLRGYEAYARANVEAYCSMQRRHSGPEVQALSSGFMTYSGNVHPEYLKVRREIELDQHTFVLMPSLDRDVCVAETVRRQTARPFGRTPAKEEAVIRSRFENYVAIPVRKIETMRPVAEVVDEIVLALVAPQ